MRKEQAGSGDWYIEDLTENVQSSLEPGVGSVLQVPAAVHSDKSIVRQGMS